MIPPNPKIAVVLLGVRKLNIWDAVLRPKLIEDIRILFEEKVVIVSGLTPGGIEPDSDAAIVKPKVVVGFSKDYSPVETIQWMESMKDGLRYDILFIETNDTYSDVGRVWFCSDISFQSVSTIPEFEKPARTLKFSSNNLSKAPPRKFVETLLRKFKNKQSGEKETEDSIGIPGIPYHIDEGHVFGPVRSIMKFVDIMDAIKLTSRDISIRATPTEAPPAEVSAAVRKIKMDFEDTVKNAPYVPSQLNVLVLDVHEPVGEGDRDLEEHENFKQAFKAVVETQAIKITGFNTHYEPSPGNPEYLDNMAEPSFTFCESFGKPITRMTTRMANFSKDLSYDMIIFELDVTKTIVQDAWLCRGMTLRKVDGFTAERDLERGVSKGNKTPWVRITFKPVRTERGEYANDVAQKEFNAQITEKAPD
jgi:hypothetical protein